MNKYNLLVTTEWSVWSPCSTCGKVGRKHKIGHCFVSLNENANTTLNETSNSTNANLETAHHKVTNLDLEYFHIFKYGIPCKSHILPESIERLHEISSRNSEVMVGFCKVRIFNNIYKIHKHILKLVEVSRIFEKFSVLSIVYCMNF